MHGRYQRDSHTLFIPGKGHFVPFIHTDRFVISSTSGAGRWPGEDVAAILAEGWVILCQRCGQVSASPSDVINRYCGHCHQFLNDVPGQMPLFGGAT